jgi:hypothetical protein
MDCRGLDIYALRPQGIMRRKLSFLSIHAEIKVVTITPVMHISNIRWKLRRSGRKAASLGQKANGFRRLRPTTIQLLRGRLDV